MIKKLLSLTMLLPIYMLSQPAILNPFNSANENLKSPQVHLMKQFADYPVDLSRGLVDIGIPLYNLKFVDKNIPMKLMFHPSGLKANVTENGMLGLKWTLNTGGFISREVRGYPDEVLNHKQTIQGYEPDWMTLYGGSFYKGNVNNNMVFRDNLGYVGYPAGTQGKYEDTEYDIFTFSLPNGQSGKFILKDINGNKTASFMPYKPFNLNSPEVESFYTTGVYTTTFSKFEIVDDEGYIYSFGKSDTGIKNYEIASNFEYVNNWLLTSITSPNKKDIIKFDYIHTNVNANSPLTPVIINDDLNNNEYFYPGNANNSNVESPLWNALESTLYDSAGYLQKYYNEPPTMIGEAKYISKIIYNDLKIDFLYDTFPADFNGLVLKKIEFSKNNSIFKKIAFDIKNPDPAPPPMVAGIRPSYLNSITINNAVNEVVEKYNFDYYHLDKFPSMNQLANKSDYWGYYNSQVENVILRDSVDIYAATWGGPNQKVTREIGSGNSRYSNSEDMKIGMLKSITYPTAGKTFFDYEANQYMDAYQAISRDCGGLRIKNIINKDTDGNEIKRKEFIYGKNENGIGFIPNYLIPDANIRNPFSEVETRYYAEYDAVINGFIDPALHTLTYRTRYYTGNFPGNYYTFLNNLVSYDKVTEYLGDVSNNIGKIENYYSKNIPLNLDYTFNYNNFKYQKNKYAIDPSNFWQGNHLLKKIEYKKTNGFYSKVKQSDYAYESILTDEIFDLSIFKFRDYVGFSTTGQPPIISATTEIQGVMNISAVFGYKFQKYTIGVENLTEIKEKLYFANDSIVQTTTNIYDINRPTFLKESKVVNSKGKTISQKYLYPFDVNTGVYGEMTTANIINPVIEKMSLNDTSITGSTLLTYKKSDTNFVPDQNFVTELLNPIPYSGFSIFNGTTKDSHYNSNSEITYDSYDLDGNPTQVTSKGGVKTCFIWGYNKKYPVAKIENIAYASIPSSLITAIESASSLTGSEASLLTALNDLRNHAALSNTMVTTYTYKPLIGITSITDSKGYITYYEYDSFGRLKQVKDQEGKILSANEYNYKN